jgi:hypothetical protein
MLYEKGIEHSSVFYHQRLLIHTTEEEADNVVWKSAVHSRSETTLCKPVFSSEEAVDPWADERQKLKRQATVCVLCGPAT